MKTLEMVVMIVVVVFVLFLFINRVNSMILLNEKVYIDLERFYAGRYIIKLITENPPYAYGICNITNDFFNIFNESEYIKFLENNNISQPIEITVRNIYNGETFRIGGYGKEYYEFRRVCYHNGSLWLISIRI